MKRFLALLLVALLSLSADAAIWASGGVKTNPASGAILADTGVLPGGESYYTVVVAATVTARLEFAVRDAANTSDVFMQTMPTVASGIQTLANIPIDVPPGGRIVVRTATSVTGVVHASIFAE